jgi:outer membrane immunogenic protein
MPITASFDDMVGAMAGATVGCNYQAGKNFVFGIESDLSWTNASGTSPYSQTNEHWLDTLRGRVGYAWNRTLLYGTAGVAFAGTSTNICNMAAGACVSSSQTRTGWVAGAGVEYAISKDISVKFEYLHADFGAGGYASTALAAGQGTIATRNIKLTDDIVRVGANWSFTSTPSF